MTADDRRSELREAFIEARGFWTPLWDDVLALDPDFLEAYLDLVRELGVTSLNGPPCLAAFHLAAALGYGDQISNRVVDAFGDIAGGVRVHDQTREAT